MPVWSPARSIRTNRAFMVEFVSIILIGLTDGVSDDPDRHQRAITSIKMALRGDLLDAVRYPE